MLGIRFKIILSNNNSVNTDISNNDDFIIGTYILFNDIDINSNNSNVVPCSFYNEEELLLNFSNIKYCNQLSILSLNVQSIHCHVKIEKICNILQNSKLNFKIIMLCETWSNETDCNLITIPNYNAFQFTRDRKSVV